MSLESKIRKLTIWVFGTRLDRGFLALGADRHVEKVVAAGTRTTHPWFFGPRHVKLLESVSAGMLSKISR